VKKKLFTIGLPLAIAVCLFISATAAVPPGTLTITGIPAEYEGKFISATIWNIPKFNKKGEPSGVNTPIAKGEYTVIANGEAKLPVYVLKLISIGKPNGYAGNDTGDIEIIISDQVKSEKYIPPLSKTAITAVSFKGGVAEVNWGDTISAGTITVTNIPETYYSVTDISVGLGAKKPLGLAGALLGYSPVTFDTSIGSEIGESDNIRNGTITMLILTQRKESGYAPFPQSGTVDIVVTPRLLSDKGKMVADSQFLFKDVSLTDGKTTLDFRQGVKQ